MSGTRREWLEGARDTLPFAASAFAYAIGFGVLARTAGLTTAETSFMSALVFAGASQFAALPLLAAAAAPATISATAAAINLRHLLMGASLLVLDSPGCLLHLRGALHKQGKLIAVRHLAELLAEALPPEEAP
ncbi:MAG: AzlC family ABC transporter permease [candidate division NC10 bacterium]|nr:AzlC family ABC transporter permease [candidate division NC10 bacterium]